jgi:dTDP-4-dehydrorhamnose 3,5-epimerase-like enzyme/dTDP-4-dehydrorhamnose reductase
MRTFDDERGELVFNIDEPPFEIKQCITSTNRKYVLRGLHCSPYPKYITVNRGKIFDVVVKPDGSHSTYILGPGDSLLVEAHYAHGFFCYEESQVVYFLGGAFDPALDRNYLWNDPILNIQWPQETKYAIISEKDTLNKTFKQIDTIVLGPNGYIGKHLLKYIPNSIGLDTRLENMDELRNHFKVLRPKYVVSAAGISGKPTIDWCEHHKAETVFTNVTCQLQLIQLCKEMGIHLTIIGSGAVYDGNELFKECDEPNFMGTFYSRMRVVLEDIIRTTYVNDVLYLRMLYPITGDGDPKCFIEKMKSRTRNIHDIKVTVSILPSLLPKLQNILDQNVTGILNFVNDDVASLSEILHMLNVKHNVSTERPNRGMCCLDTTKLKKFIDVENVSILKNSYQ